jgi:hypothetical protein
VIRVMERHGLSQRHACELVGLDRSTLRYRCRRPDDSALRQRLRELAAERRRFGYRRLGWMLAREGHALNHRKLYRLYREERLMVRLVLLGEVRDQSINCRVEQAVGWNRIDLCRQSPLLVFFDVVIRNC